MIPIHAIEAIVSFAILVIVIYGPWQAVCTDIARQEMFSYRDDISDHRA
jgi:hypothetical protein